MRLTTYLARTLAFHWRSHLAVALGAMTATATLTGALLVGDSMRASLRDTALARLGRVDHAMLCPRFFRQQVAKDLADASATELSVARACPVILLPGGVVHADTHRRANHITVMGVDDDFWKLAAPTDTPPPTAASGRSVVWLNESLASQLGARPGDDVLLRIQKPSSVSTETLLGRRDDTSLTKRLTVQAIVTTGQGGDFALRPSQAPPANAWVPLETLQRALDQPGQANAMLIETTTQADADTPTNQLQRMLRPLLTLPDLGLRLRIDHERGYIALESDGVLVDPAVEQSAVEAAAALGAHASPILTYLANTISAGSPADHRTVIPYSTVTALDVSGLTLTDGSAAPQLAPGEILLNKWAADDLGVTPGDRVTLTYFVTGPFGRLDSRETSFALRGIVRMDAAAADPGFAPTYPGVTDTDNLAEWDPPFPVDMKTVRDKDEAYWDQYRTSPKAFVSLADGRRLWTTGTERFGQCTSVRLRPADQTDPDILAGKFTTELANRLNPTQLGFTLEPVRQRALAASTGTTDFGMLFVSFSFFLIVSAAMLVALLFRLGAERRAAEIGLLLATGFRPATVSRLLIAEGAVIAGIGTVPGLIAALGYAWLMLAGLKTWWAGAVNAPFLQLHAPPATLVIGFVAGMAVALASIAWSVRKLSRQPAHALLAGTVATAEDHATPRRRHRTAAATGIIALVAAISLTLLSVVSDVLPQTVGFFGGGAALVVACLCAIQMWLHARRRGTVQTPGPAAMFRLGVRNAPRHPGRSLLAAGLIASATFVTAAIGALRIDPDTDTTHKHSPAGGFTLLAESAIPLPYDLDTPQGRESLAFSEPAAAQLNAATVVQFRLRPGDAASCRGLYRPTDPRIIGAGRRFIDRGGFVFASTTAQTERERQNPWTLLEHDFDDGAVPVIGDEAAVTWQLHLGLGEDLVIADERGQQQHLRFVALLAGSVLQDELVVADSRFTQLFPSITGHAFFLIDVPPAAAQDVADTLERELTAFAFDVTPTAQRLADFSAVQNTYLRTFQTLGGLGVILGTVGLTVVLLRSIVERRGELALMRALGFSRAAIGWMVLAENVLLVVAGLAAGALPALLAIAPHALHRPGQVPWLSLGLTLLGVLAVGIGAGAVALRPTLRAPILPALRRE